MTDNDTSNQQPAATQDWTARANAYAARKQAIFPENRKAIFDALERQGIEAVTMTFDGCGDSGQIDNVYAAPGEGDGLPATEIEQKRADWHTDAIQSGKVPLRTAIEDLCYELLEATHCGWENNEGGFGEFVFDVPPRTITLEFNQRYESVESYAHEFQEER